MLAFGERFADAADLLPILAVAMGWMAVVNVLVYFHIAMASRAYLISLGRRRRRGGGDRRLPRDGRAGGRGDRDRGGGRGVSPVPGGGLDLPLAAAASSRPARDRRTRAARDPRPLGRPPVPQRRRGVARRRRAAAPASSTRSARTSSSSSPTGAPTRRSRRRARSRPIAVRVIEYPLREGKGHALRVGLREARGEYVAFCDADGDIAAEALPSFLTLMRLYDPDVVLGSKRHPLSDVYYPPAAPPAELDLPQAHAPAVPRERAGHADRPQADPPRRPRRGAAADAREALRLRSRVPRRRAQPRLRARVRGAGAGSTTGSRATSTRGATLGIVRDTLAIFYRHYILDTYRRGRPARGAGPAVRSRAAALARARPGLLHQLARRGEPGGRRRRGRHPRGREAMGGPRLRRDAARRRGSPARRPTARIDGVHVRRLGRLRTGSFHLRVQRELARLRGFDVVVESVNTIPFLTPLWRSRLPTTVPAVPPAGGGRLGRRAARGRSPAWADGSSSGFSGYTARRRSSPSRPRPATTSSSLGFTNVAVVRQRPGRAAAGSASVAEGAHADVPVRRAAGGEQAAPATRSRHSGAIRRAIPDARLWLIGQGPLEAELRAALPAGRRAARPSLRGASCTSGWRRAHCLLVPSVREGWGLVVVEANAVGNAGGRLRRPGIRDSIRPGETGRARPGRRPGGARAARRRRS